VTPSELAQRGAWRPSNPATLHLFLRHSTMFDELWSEIQDAPGEIFDIPEQIEEDDDKSFNQLLNSEFDF